MNEHLIIDVGMHTGRDTEFYLKKGFNVVAIEANPALVDQTKSRLAQYVDEGTLTICNVAVADHEGEIEFFINDNHDDWGTTSKEFAARNEGWGTKNSTITVRCKPFDRILEQYGMPYYLKIDIEGADLLCVQALVKYDERPRYISIEAGLTSFDETFSELSLLWNLGYRQFKIVNQAMNYKVKCPNPPLEGGFVDYRFDGVSSGPFGEEAPGKWISVQETINRYQRLLSETKYFGRDGSLYGTPVHRLYEALKREQIGWYDFHARLGAG